MTNETFEEIYKVAIRNIRKRARLFAQENAKWLGPHLGIFAEYEDGKGYSCPDLVQEALIKIWQRAKENQSPAYYQKISENAWKDLLRTAMRREKIIPMAEFVNEELAEAAQLAISGLDSKTAAPGDGDDCGALVRITDQLIFPKGPSRGRPPGVKDKKPRKRRNR